MKELIQIWIVNRNICIMKCVCTKELLQVRNIHICMYKRMNLCLYVCNYVCFGVYLCLCARKWISLYMYVYLQTCTNKGVNTAPLWWVKWHYINLQIQLLFTMLVCENACIEVCMHNMYLHIYKCKHVYENIYAIFRYRFLYNPSFHEGV